ncbi:MAG: DUF2849 domain-containing protein [Gammaproteobacteria bacterium]|nr:DUF2849 domain-containing protein [Gammaproteobacteria bacterium]
MAKINPTAWVVAGNRLTTGETLFYSNSGWVTTLFAALKLSSKDELLNLAIDPNEVVSVEVVAVDERGELIDIRERMRIDGPSVKPNSLNAFREAS